MYQNDTSAFLDLWGVIEKCMGLFSFEARRVRIQKKPEPMIFAVAVNLLNKVKRRRTVLCLLILLAHILSYLQTMISYKFRIYKVEATPSLTS